MWGSAVTENGKQAPAAGAAMQGDVHGNMQGELIGRALDASDVGVVIYDAADRLACCNSAFRQFFPDWSPHFRIGRCRRDILHDCLASGMLPPKGVESGEAWIDRVVSERLPSWTNPEQQLADGRWLRGNLKILEDGGILVTQVDITAEKQREMTLLLQRSEAERADRSKIEFLSNMTHELRTPLNAILGFSELIMSEVNGPLGDPRYRSYAASIRESGDYLLSIINDLLDMAKFNAGRTQLAEARVDLAGIVAAVARMIEGRAQHGAIDFHVALEPPTPDLLADERQLKQMLLNLASNAVKFTPPGGEVHIAGVMTEEGGYALTVRDTGIGMAEAEIPVALAPFGQIDSPLGRGHYGTGLGLPLVKSMIEAHGGRLLLVSRPGTGTTATLLFPARRVLTDRAAPAGEQTAK